MSLEYLFIKHIKNFHENCENHMGDDIQGSEACKGRVRNTEPSVPQLPIQIVIGI